MVRCHILIIVGLVSAIVAVKTSVASIGILPSLGDKRPSFHNAAPGPRRTDRRQLVPRAIKSEVTALGTSAIYDDRYPWRLANSTFTIKNAQSIASGARDSITVNIFGSNGCEDQVIPGWDMMDGTTATVKIQALSLDVIFSSSEDMVEHLRREVTKLKVQNDEMWAAYFRPATMFDPLDALRRHWEIGVTPVDSPWGKAGWQPGFMFNIVDPTYFEAATTSSVVPVALRPSTRIIGIVLLRLVNVLLGVVEEELVTNLRLDLLTSTDMLPWQIMLWCIGIMMTRGRAYMISNSVKSLDETTEEQIMNGVQILASSQVLGTRTVKNNLGFIPKRFYDLYSTRFAQHPRECPASSDVQGAGPSTSQPEGGTAGQG